MRIIDVDAVPASDRYSLTDRLLPDEQVEEAFSASSTIVLFTDRRILTVQRHNLLAERTETTSYPYRSVRMFSVLEGVPGESRQEVKIWIGSDAQPLHLRANGETDLAALQRLLATRLS